MPGIAGQPNVTPGGGISQAAADARYAPITPISSHVTVQFDKTNNTLADVPGLSVTLAAGTYVIRIEIYMTVNTSAGSQIEVAGTVTQSGVLWLLDGEDGVNPFTAPIPFATPTTLGTNAVGAFVSHLAIITGAAIVTVGGTLKVQFAQDATNATASSVLVGSNMVATKIN